MRLSERLRAYVEYERRIAAQNLQNLDALLTDLQALEQDYESMRSRSDTVAEENQNLQHELACKRCVEGSTDGIPSR